MVYFLRKITDIAHTIYGVIPDFFRFVWKGIVENTETTLSVVSTLSSLAIAIVAVVGLIIWSKREKWNQDQKDARDLLRKLSELKFYINEARPMIQNYPELTDELLLKHRIQKKISELSDREKEGYQSAIYYSDFMDKVKGGVIDLRAMQDIIKTLGWHEDFIKNIKYIEVLIRVLESHIRIFIESKFDPERIRYFYWDMEKYKESRERGEYAWGNSMRFFTGQELEENKGEKYQKYLDQGTSVMYNFKRFDSDGEMERTERNFFDREIDDTFNRLFDLLGEKIRRP